MPEQIVLELWQIVPTIVYFAVAVVLFGGTIYALIKILPFSFRKEIEEDHNTAFAILVGAGLVALAIVIAAAIT